MATKTIKFEPVVAGDEVVIDNKANINLETLWTNSSPTSSFSAQDIPIDLSKYRFVYIQFRGVANVDADINEISAIDGKDHIAFYLSTSGGLRRIRYYNPKTTGVHFNDASENNTTTNTCIIPQFIYGIR